MLQVAGTSGQEGNIIMVNNNKTKAAPVPKAAAVPKIGKPVRDDDVGVTYMTLVMPDNSEWFIGQDDKTGWFVFDPEGESGWEPLFGFSGYQHQSVMLRHFAIYLAGEQPFPKVKGTPDPKIPGMVLVPLDEAPAHPAFPIMAKDLGLPKSSSLFRVDPGVGVECVVTIDDGGLHLGWDTCGACARRMTRCTCANGMTPARAIVWCVTGAATGWVTPTSHVPTVLTAGTASVAPKGRSTPTPALVPVKASKAAQKPVQKASPKAAEATGMMADLDSGNVDMADLDKAAADMAAATPFDSPAPKRRVVVKRRK